VDNASTSTTVDDAYQELQEDLAGHDQAIVETQEALARLHAYRQRLLGHMDALKRVADAGHGALPIASLRARTDDGDAPVP